MEKDYSKTGRRKTDLEVISEKLKNSENNFLLISDNMPDAFALHRVIFDDDNTPIDYEYIFANESFGKHTGMDHVEIIGKTIKEIAPEIVNDKTDWIKVYGNVALSGKSTTIRSYSEFLKRWYDVNAYCPKLGYFAVVFDDITKDVQKDKKLELKRLQISEIVEQSPNGTIMMDKDGKIRKINRKLIDQFNIRDTSIEYPSLKLSRINNFANFKLVDFVQDLLDEKVHNKDVYRIRHRQSKGVYKWYNIRGYNTIGADNEHINTIILFCDITKQIEIENHSTQSKKELNRYYDILPESLYELDADMNIVKVNKSFCDIFKLEKEDMHGKNICELFADEREVERCVRKLKERIDKRDIKTYNQKLFTNTSSDEEQLIEMTSILKWKGENGASECTGSYGLARDISPEKEEYKIKIKKIRELKQMVDDNYEKMSLSKELLDNGDC